MFKTLNQNEMMYVNGGFYYVPVYNRYYRKTTYKLRATGQTVGVSIKKLGETFLGTQQVASGSGISAIYHDIYSYVTEYVG